MSLSSPPCNCPSDVFCERHSLKVPGVPARSDGAEVVDGKPVRDAADMPFVHQSMHVGSVQNTVPTAPDGASPYPAGVVSPASVELGIKVRVDVIPVLDAHPDFGVTVGFPSRPMRLAPPACARRANAVSYRARRIVRGALLDPASERIAVTPHPQVMSVAEATDNGVAIANKYTALHYRSVAHQSGYRDSDKLGPLN